MGGDERGRSGLVVGLLALVLLLLVVAVGLLAVIVYSGYRAKERAQDQYEAVQEAARELRDRAREATSRAAEATSQKWAEWRDDPRLREAVDRVDDVVGQKVLEAEEYVRAATRDVKAGEKLDEWQRAARARLADQLEAAGRRIRAETESPATTRAAATKPTTRRALRVRK